MRYPSEKKLHGGKTLLPFACYLSLPNGGGLGPESQKLIMPSGKKFIDHPVNMKMLYTVI